MPASLKRKRQESSLVKRTQRKPVNQMIVADEIEEPEDDMSEDEEEREEKENMAESENMMDSENIQKHSNKLPSAGELRAINEARDLYKNNTFKAQLDLLLAEVRPNASFIPPLERTLQKLHAHLTSLPSIPPVHPLEAEKTLLELFSSRKKGRRTSSVHPSVSIPYPHPLPSLATAWKVAFEPPEAMNVVGSWSDSLAVRKPDGTPFGVDLVVEMPAKLFQDKDYRNARFFYKRAYYLSCLAASIARSSLHLDVAYEAPEGDLRGTTLLLSPTKDSEHDFSQLHATIRVIPVLSDQASIPLHRLSPAQSNIRSAPPLPSEAVPHSEADQHQSDTQLPTPHYNNTLALSFAQTSRARLIGAHKAVGEVPAFADGLALLRVWANQRGYGSGSVPGQENKGNYCVYGFERLGAWWACVLEVLIFGEEPVQSDVGSVGKMRNKRPLVGKGLSSYQLFRAALDFLAKHNFQDEPVFMRVVESGQKYDPSEWTAHHGAVFVDATGTVNLLAGVPVCSLDLLRRDAAMTLQQLNEADDAFSQVFLKDLREPHARFDAVIRINLARIRPRPSPDFHSTQAATLHALISTVRKALGTRAQVVVAMSPRSSPFSIAAGHATPLSTLTLGILFEPMHATRLVDHGPPASTPEVDAFRAFWGPKAELRRFKDGSIVESCVWDEGIVRVEDREGVPARIVRYILKLHFGLAEADVCVLAGDYGRMFTAPALRGRGEGAYKDALVAFDKFYRELKALEDEGDMPLMLVSAKACSPSLRYTSVFPPRPILTTSKTIHPSTSYLPPFEVALQFERSSQWPDDLRSIQKVKSALFESMARGLSRRNGAACQACVVIDEDAMEIEDGCALEVVLDGWAFHARVGHNREVSLLQEMMAVGRKPPRVPVPSAQEREAAKHALHVYRRRFVHAPAHHGAILALHHKLPSFSYTVRLVKRWLGAHWLSACVTDEAVELFCAQAFLRYGSDVPACGKRGFVRVVSFLGSWDGVAYIPLYEAVEEAGAVSAGTHSVEAGKGNWRLVTKEDSAGTMWCEDVNIVVASRIREVAKATMLCLKGGTPTIAPLLEHPDTDYDFLIEIDPLAISRYWEGVRASPTVWKPSGYANLPSDSGEAAPIRVGFNPAEMFLRTLQRVYGDTMELFYDVYGGTSIGGVWNPAMVGSKRLAWRVFSGYSSLPLEPRGQQKEKPEVAFNVEGVLSEIQRMGAGIIKNLRRR